MDALIDKVAQLVKEDIKERVQEIDIDAEQEETFKKMLKREVDLICKHASLEEVLGAHAATLDKEAASDLVKMTHIQNDITKFKMEFAYYQGLKEGIKLFLKLIDID